MKDNLIIKKRLGDGPTTTLLVRLQDYIDSRKIFEIR